MRPDSTHVVMGAAVVTHPANSAMLSWRTLPIFISSCPLLEAKRRKLLSHAPPQLQDIDTYTDMNLPDPARDQALFANVMLGIDWIEDIEVQAFCINFLAALKELRAELIAKT